jgi:hypothetical protein
MEAFSNRMLAVIGLIAVCCLSFTYGEDEDILGKVVIMISERKYFNASERAFHRILP